MDGLATPPWMVWPHLQYILKGVKRLQSIEPSAARLPITPSIMQKLQGVWAQAPPDLRFKASMLWAACCLGFFGFMRAGEFTSDSRDPQEFVYPMLRKTHIHHPQWCKYTCEEPYGKEVAIYLGRTHSVLCPVAAVLNYLAIRPPGEGPLFVRKDSTLLTREFCKRGQGSPGRSQH